MLTEKLKEKRDFVQGRNFKQYRKEININLRKSYSKLHYKSSRRVAKLLEYMCEQENPIVFSDEKITFSRTISNIPIYYKRKDLNRECFWEGKFIFDHFGNVCCDWALLLREGIQGRIDKINQLQKEKLKKDEEKYLEDVLTSLNSVVKLAEKYEKQAIEVGNEFVAKTLRNVPKYGANNFAEALQSIKFIHSMLYLNDCAHIGLGRFDQYMYPYFKKDIEAGHLTKEEAKNLIAEFFISLNKDTDLYHGIQQGDNGQSMMLGGCKPEDGTSAVNELTYMVLEVSKDLKLIDPKINLRIDSNTPIDLLELGCELTKVGLGFPQYSNDEVVIPALVNAGYSIEDARNYTVAACWEFIIPGKGIEIVNLGAVSFPYAVDFAFEKCMKSFGNFSIKKFEKEIKKNIDTQVHNILSKRKLKLLPSPLATAFFTDMLETKRDVTKAAKYQNIGLHGAGSSNAADAIVSIKTIFERLGKEGLKGLLEAKQNNFDSYEELRKELVENMPKVGNANPIVDKELAFLFNCFADVTDKYSTKKRKIRAGSGSAMHYIWLTDNNVAWTIEPKIKATADGRLNGEPLSTSLAPSHGIKVDGVLSVLKSYSNIDYSRIINGGPITIELAPSVFNADEGIRKLAQLIMYFVKVGNQQLQLNVLDASVLEDAMANPEKHKNLIVRVWGWSGYFTELAPEYQKHVLNRHKYNL